MNGEEKTARSFPLSGIAGIRNNSAIIAEIGFRLP